MPRLHSSRGTLTSREGMCIQKASMFLKISWKMGVGKLSTGKKITALHVIELINCCDVPAVDWGLVLSTTNFTFVIARNLRSDLPDHLMNYVVFRHPTLLFPTPV